MSQQEQLEAILKDFEQASTDAYTKKESGIDYEALDKSYEQATQAITALIQEAVNEGSDEDKLWAVKAWFVDSCKHEARTLKEVKLVEYIDYLEDRIKELSGGSNNE